MTRAQKDSVSEWFTWILRGVIVFGITFIIQRLDFIVNLQKEQAVQDSRIRSLEKQYDRVAEDQRFEAKRINMLERNYRFRIKNETDD